MSKYGDDIRRIARVKELEKGDGKSEEKPAIPGKRGVAIDNSGRITSFQSNPGSSSISNATSDIIAGLLAQAATDDLKKALQQALGLTEGDDGLENAAEAPNKPLGAGGSRSIEDVIDGVADADPYLNEITGFEDIVTADNFNVNLQGQYPPPDATSISAGQPNPTDRWTSSEEPPNALDFISGAWFSIAHSGGTLGTFYTNRYGEAISWDVENTSVWASFFDWTTKSGGAGGAPNYPNATDLATISGTNSTVTYNARILRTTDSPGSPTGSTSVIMSACNMPTPPITLAPYCNVTPPKETQWPSSQQSVFALQSDGLIKSSQYDVTDIGQAYRDGVGILVADFASGTRKAVLEPGRDNTTLVYEIDSNATPTGKVRVYTRGKVYSVFGGGIASEQPHRLKAIDSVTNINNYRLPNQADRIIRTTGVVKGRIYRK